MTAEHIFYSETDTEVISHLVEKYYKNHANLEQAVSLAINEIEGSYAIIVMADKEPGLVVAGEGQPIDFRPGNNENYIASDVTGVLEFTNPVIYLEDGDIATVAPDSIMVRNSGETVVRKENQIQWTAEQAQKCGYEHYMLKEIFEQPQVIRNTLTEYLSALRQTLQRTWIP